MIEMFICRKCERILLVSRHSHKKGNDVCRTCGTKIELIELSYERWISMSERQRKVAAEKYCKS